MGLFHGTTCQLLPQINVESQTNPAHPNLEYKRQSDSPTLQCITDHISDALQGNNSTFVSECKSSATLETDLSDVDIADVSDLQARITAIYGPLCTPECGNAVLDAYSDCGLSNIDDSTGSQFFARAKTVIDGVCGTNQNGDVCYQLYGDAFQFAITERSCGFQFRESGECICQSFLSGGVSRYGCCINIYHYLNRINNPRELYDGCNVPLPNDCNNSPFEDGAGMSDTTPPLTGSGTMSTTTDGADISFAPTITLMLSAIICFTVLNI